MRYVRLDEVDGAPGPGPLFEGDVLVRDLMSALDCESLGGYLTTFRDGGGTAWHVHDADQVLIVMAGSGIVEDDRELRRVSQGDVVLVPAGTRHRHGSEPGAELTRISFMRTAPTRVV